MTLPDDLPVVPEPDTEEPDTNNESRLTRSELRAFVISAPVSTHFNSVNCATAQCPEYLYGMKVVCDTRTDLGNRQIQWVQNSGLDYLSWWHSDFVTLVIVRGQADAFTHWVRQTSALDYAIKDGDAAITDVSASVFLNTITEHMSLLAATQMSVGVPVYRVPQLYLDDVIPMPEHTWSLSFTGYGKFSDSLTGIDLIMPLDATDTSKPIRLLRLADFYLVSTGILDLTVERDYNIRSLQGRQILVGLQVGQRLLTLQCRIHKVSLYRSSGVPMWRVLAKL